MSAPVADPSAALKVTPGTPVAEQVKAQLQRDYPPGALAWVDGLSWSGPSRVPLDQIDRTAGDWSAADDKRKVAAFATRIGAGWKKPAVLIRTPGKRLLYATDGHTRISACAQLGQPVTAWIGTATTATGGWLTTHHKQLSNDGAALELAMSPGGRPMDTSPFSASTTSNWVARAGGLPDYVRGVAHALLRKGRARDEAQAISMAVGLMQDWASGRTPNGKGHVHPAVQAAAAKALAQWEAMRAKAHAS